MNGNVLLLRRSLLPFLSMLLLLTSCATPAEAPVAFGPQPPGSARLILYRPFHYYGPSLVLTLALDDRVIGALPRNAALYRDIAPGTYTINFSPTRPAPSQFKTVTLAPGDVFFVKIDALPPRACGSGLFGGCDDITGFTSLVVDPPTAQYELQAVPLLHG
jgi:hypothetical protein